VDGIHASEAKLRELVELSRVHGRSWGEIAIALGVSRQAAHERFADKIHA
jgi:DNA-directed RNA polymerase specialized sigma24 family protein